MIGRACTAALLLGTLAGAPGCLNAPPPDMPEPTSEGASEAPPANLMAMSAIDLRLYDRTPTGGLEQKPSFWLHAEEFRLDDAGNYYVRDARAVVYDDLGQEEAISVVADGGRFEPGVAAFLEGSVYALVGSMALYMEDVACVISETDAVERIASDKPVTLRDAKLDLKASNVVMNPREESFEMKDVRGTIQFEDGL